MLVLKPREKVVGVIAALALFSVFWFYSVISPIRDYEIQLDRDLKVKNFELFEAKKVLQASPVGSLSDQALMAFFAEALPQEEMLRLIKEIETAATQENLQVSETKPQPLSQKDNWLELKVIISFEGSIEDTVKFLYRLEQSPKPLLVNSMSLETDMAREALIRGRLEIGRVLILKSKEL